MCFWGCGAKHQRKLYVVQKAMSETYIFGIVRGDAYELVEGHGGKVQRTRPRRCRRAQRNVAWETLDPYWIHVAEKSNTVRSASASAAVHISQNPSSFLTLPIVRLCIASQNSTLPWL